MNVSRGVHGTSGMTPYGEDDLLPNPPLGLVSIYLQSRHPFIPGWRQPDSLLSLQTVNRMAKRMRPRLH
jgi:hypothetical protein